MVQKRSLRRSLGRMKIHGFQKYFDFEDEKICQAIEARGVTVSEEGDRLLLLAEELC